MSSHPLGPWTQTVVSNAPDFRSGYFVDSRFPSSYNWTASNSIVGTSSIRTGVNNGNIRPYPPSAASLQLDSGEFVGCSGVAKAKLGSYTFTHVNLGLSPAIQSSTNSIDPQAVLSTAQLNALRKQNALFNSMIFAGEFKESLRTGKNIVDLISGKHNHAYSTLIKDLKKFKQNSYKSAAELISNHYLEYKFGIAPLLSDMESLGQAVAQSVIQLNRPARVSSGWSNDAVQSVSGSTGAGQLSWTQVTEYHQSVHAKAGASYIVKGPPSPPTWQETWGLTFHDLAPTAWELLPYSWLVDYFTNVSDFFEAASFHRGLLEKGWYTLINEKLVNVSTSVPVPADSLGFTLLSSSAGKGAWRSFSFNRGVWSVDSFVPVFQFQEPDLTQLSIVAAFAGTKLLKPHSISRSFRLNPNILSNYF